MITFVITASLDLQPSLLEEIDPQFLDEIQERRIQQYRDAIPIIVSFANSIGAKVIIVENNGPRETFLHTLNCQVLYTITNQFTLEKGVVELLDILQCLYTFQIPDDELIVKVTGRYLLDPLGTFCQKLKQYNPETTDCILRYGSFVDPSNDLPQEDCLTGLIAMKSKYIKQINYRDVSSIEHEWAKTSLTLDPSRVQSIRGPIGYRMYSWHTKELTYRDL